MEYDRRQYETIIKEFTASFWKHGTFWGTADDLAQFQHKAQDIFDQLWQMGFQNKYEELLLQFIEEIIKYSGGNNVENRKFIEARIKGIEGVLDRAIRERRLHPNEIYVAKYFKAKQHISVEQLKSIIENAYKNIGDLKKISNVGAIEEHVPEWGRICSDKTGWPHKIHSFRIDEHTFVAIDHLKQIPEFMWLDQTYQKIISLVLFFHDLGKNGGSRLHRPATDPDHPKRSFFICKKRMQQLGYKDYIINIVGRLVYYHDSLGDLAFKVPITKKAAAINSLVRDLKEKQNLLLLKIITKADIYAVKKNGRFLFSKVGFADLSKEQAIELEYTRIISRSFPSNSLEEKRSAVHMIFQEKLPYGHQKFMLYCINHWEEIFRLIGFSKDRVRMVELLMQFEPFLLQRGIEELLDIKEISGSQFIYVLESLQSIQPLLVRHGTRQIIDIIRPHGKEFLRNFAFFVGECILPRINLFMDDVESYQYLFEIYIIAASEVDAKIVNRITNSCFDYFFTGQSRTHPSKEEIQSFIGHERIQSKQDKVDISSLQSSQESRCKTLSCGLTRNEIQAVIKGTIPLCYYHITSIDSLKLILEYGAIAPLLLKAFHKKLSSLNPDDPLYERKRYEIQDYFEHMKEADLQKIQSVDTFKGVRSKFFKKEMKWLTFLAAPPPFNAKEDFYKIISNYSTQDSVILELSPQLYKHILWNRIMMGGVFASEEQLVHHNKLTRDLVIDKNIPTSFICKLYVFKGREAQVQELLHRHQLPLSVHLISDYALVYRAEMDELKYLAKQLKIAA
ncbi:MAG: hypothetical protein ACQESG_01695 [Nanobdellota archaeon]